LRRKRQGRKKSPHRSKGKNNSKNIKRHENQPIDPLEQEPLIPVTLEEFFLVDFFDKVTAKMTSCFELKEEEDKGKDK